MPTSTFFSGETLPRCTSTEKPPTLAGSGIPVTSGLVPPPPTPADVAGHSCLSRLSATVKTEILRPAVADTGTSMGKEERTPPPSSTGRRHATGAHPDVTSFPALFSFLEPLREDVRVSMAGAVETLAAGRTPGNFVKLQRALLGGLLPDEGSRQSV